MELYKLTDENDETFGRTKWGENVTHKATGIGGLCSSGVIHAYTDPLLAVFYNPIHGGFRHPHMWKAKSDDMPISDGTKVGVKTLTTFHVSDPPEISIVGCVEIAIRCALAVYHNLDFELWANNWLSGKDRTSVLHTQKYFLNGLRVMVVNMPNSAHIAAACATLASQEASWALQPQTTTRELAANGARVAQKVAQDLDVLSIIRKCVER